MKSKPEAQSMTFDYRAFTHMITLGGPTLNPTDIFIQRINLETQNQTTNVGPH